ncbi:MAG: hypothetical protein R2822_26530 [Spirosomataceae bacterium]
MPVFAQELIFLLTKTTIGLLATGMLNQFRMNGISSTDFLDKTQTLTSSFDTDTHNHNLLKNFTAILNLKHDYGQGRELTADADYSFFDGNSGNDLNTIYHTPSGTIKQRGFS